MTKIFPSKALATASLRAAAKGATLDCLGSVLESTLQLEPMYLTNLVPVGRCDRAEPRSASFLAASLLIVLFCHFESVVADNLRK